MDECIICLKKTKTAKIANVFVDTKTRHCSSNIVHVFSHIFNVDEENFVGNFNAANIYCCTGCSMYVKKLTELFAQLQLIEKTIKNVINETKAKILLSNVEKGSHHANEQNKNGSPVFLVRDYFRNRAINDLNPTVNVQRLASKIIPKTESDVDLQSRKSHVKKTTKHFDDFLLVRNELNSEMLDIKTELIDDNEESINVNHESDVLSPLPLEKSVIARNIADTVIATNTVDTVIATNTVDTVISPNTSDTVIATNTADTVIATNTTDTVIAANTTDPVVAKDLADTVKTRTKEINKVVDYGEESGADEDDHLNYSAGESDSPEIEKSIAVKRSHKDRRASIKKNNAKRCKRVVRKNVNYKLITKSGSSECSFQCVTCYKQFRKRSYVEMHIRRVHWGEFIKRTEDGKVLTSRGKIKTRFSSKSIHLGGGKLTYNNVEYTKDISSGKYFCISCNKNVSDIHNHINRVHVPRTNEEHYQKFTVLGQPRKTYRVLKLEGGKRLWNGMEYRIEIKDPTMKKFYHCGTCDHVVESAVAIKRHISMKHLNPGSKKCYVCEEILPCKNSYDQHMVSHKDSRIATCEKCGETFRHKTSLCTHIRRVHLGERPYICEFCGKRFFTKKDCRVHSAIHNANRSPKAKQKIPEAQDEASAEPQS